MKSLFRLAALGLAILLACSSYLLRPAPQLDASPVAVQSWLNGLAAKLAPAASLSGTPAQNTMALSSLPASGQWDLDYIDAAGLWQQSGTGNNVVVAVLDSGIDDNCPGLAGQVVGSVNFSSSQTSSDVLGHGTEVAAIIAGIPGPDSISGVAYSCRLLNVKVANDDGSVNVNALASGIIWAANNGANVINISIQIANDDLGLKSAVEYAWDKGCLIVAAAGNNIGAAQVYPAAYGQCISVTAIRPGGELAPLADSGDWVNLAAPGYEIPTLNTSGTSVSVTGTSFAAAIISGIAADLFSAAGRQASENEQIKTSLINMLPG